MSENVPKEPSSVLEDEDEHNIGRILSSHFKIGVLQASLSFSFFPFFRICKKQLKGLSHEHHISRPTSGTDEVI